MYDAIARTVFFAAGVVLLYRLTRRGVGQIAAILAVLLWLLVVHRVALGGLEFSLHALGIFTISHLYLEHFTGELPDQYRPYLALGTVASLTFLARLDSLVVTLILGLFLLKKLLGSPMKSRGRYFLLFALPIAGTLLLYFFLNGWLFQLPFPISSVVKRSWSAQLLLQDPIYQEQGWLAAKLALLRWSLQTLNPLHMLGLLLGLLGWGSLYVLRIAFPGGPWLPPMAKALFPFWVAGLIHFLNYLIIYHSGLPFPPWYYVIQPWLSVSLVALLVDRVWQIAVARGKVARLIVLLLWATIPLYTLLGLERSRLHEQQGMVRDPLHDAAQWASAHLPKNARVGSWNAGTIGYLSGRQVVNLDGLVNSWDYFQTERHDLCQYWQRANITHLVDVFENGQALSVIPTLATYNKCLDKMTLLWSDNRYGTPWRTEVYRLDLSGGE